MRKRGFKETKGAMYVGCFVCLHWLHPVQFEVVDVL